MPDLQADEKFMQLALEEARIAGEEGNWAMGWKGTIQSKMKSGSNSGEWG